MGRQLKKVFLGVITLYQKVFSPFFPPACRFSPTCSQYAREALESYPLSKALFLVVCRLLKCHPFHPGGYDPVKKATNNNGITL